MWANRHECFDGKPINQKKLRLLEEDRAQHAGRDSDLRELLACCFSDLELIDGMVGEVVVTLNGNFLHNPKVPATSFHN